MSLYEQLYGADEQAQCGQSTSDSDGRKSGVSMCDALLQEEDGEEQGDRQWESERGERLEPMEEGKAHLSMYERIMNDERKQQTRSVMEEGAKQKIAPQRSTYERVLEEEGQHEKKGNKTQRTLADSHSQLPTSKYERCCNRRRWLWKGKEEYRC